MSTTRIKTFALSVILIVSGLGLSAQPHCKYDGNWKEKIRSEKIAFLTTEANLTPEDAQAFWPVYNEVWSAIDKARHNVMKSYGNLVEGNKNNVGEKELKALLDAYNEAIAKEHEIKEESYHKFLDVLPVEKVAKIYIAEEKFRRSQFHKLRQPVSRLQ